MLFSFEPNEDISQIKAVDAHIERTKDHATEGGYSLVLRIQPGEKPGVTLSSGAKPWDWRPFGAVTLNIMNADENPATLTIEVKDAAGARTSGVCKLLGRGVLAIALPLNSPDPLDMGMRGPAAIPGYRLASSDYRKIDLSRVSSIALSLAKTERPRELFIDAVRLIPGITYDKIVDPLGQFALAEWSGKMKNESEFAQRRAAEEAAIARSPALPDRDEYGGWAAGPVMKATGFFRTAKREGKWWLVTPGGHLFLSFGVNSVTTTEGDTITEGREQMFQWLPARGTRSLHTSAKTETGKRLG